MKKKTYEKPAMRVYEMKQRARLLVGSTRTSLDASYYEEDL